MSWTKLSDDFPDRLVGLSDAAFRLHVSATVYANRLNLDGEIPKARLSLLPVPQRTRRPTVVRELVAADLWREGRLSVSEQDGRIVVRLDHSNVWTLVDFYEAQLSSAEVTAQRAYDALRQRIRFARDADAKADLREEETRAKAALFEAREQRRDWVATVSGRIPAPATTRNGQFCAPLKTESVVSDDTKRANSFSPDAVSNTGSFDARERGYEGTSLVSHSATHTAPASPVPVPSRPVPQEDEDEGEVGTAAARGGEPRAPAVPQRDTPCLACGKPVTLANQGERWVNSRGSPVALHYDCEPPDAETTAHLEALRADTLVRMRGEPVHLCSRCGEPSAVEHADCRPTREPVMSCPQCGEPVEDPDDARMVLLDDVFMVEHVGCRSAREAVAL
jgi:hypothetical protein